MPIGEQTPISAHTGNGVAVTFAYAFGILALDDLKVRVGGVDVASGYTVAGVGDRTGGTVTFSAPPGAGVAVLLYRDISLSRSTDYQANGDLREDVLDNDFDRVWMALQDQLLIAGRAVRAPVGESFSELPAASSRALRLLGFDSAGQPALLTSSDDEGAALALDLLSGTDGAKGGGQVGHGGALNYAAGTIGAVLNDTAINVKMFPWLAKGDGITDDYPAIQAAFDFLPASTRILFPDGAYAVKRMLRQHKSGVTLQGTGRYSSKIIPHPDFDRLTYDALLEVGAAGTNSHIVRDLGVLATYNSDGNDLSGLALNADYNVDVIDCYLQSGNQITRENGGLKIRRGKHTTIMRTHMHNGYAYGALIVTHNVGLKFLACALDETPVAIKSAGNIVELTVTDGCSFGTCAPNATHPTTSSGSQIDLRTGSHTLVSITSNSFLGNINTKMSIDVNDVQVLTVDGNVFSGIRRYAVCHRGSKQLIVSDNTFYECGADGSTNTASAGTSNPDTSTFCCDVFKASAFNRSTTLAGNATDNPARPMAWIEGAGSSPSTSATTIMGNNAQGGAAYIHGVSVTDSRPFVNGKRLIEALVPVSFTIPSLTYTAGQSQFGNFTYSGLETTDVLTASADINMPAGMILNVRVLSTGNGRWIVTNQTGAGVTPPAVTAVAVATKG